MAEVLDKITYHVVVYNIASEEFFQADIRLYDGIEGGNTDHSRAAL